MDILLTGSVAYDYLMKFPGHFREHILPDQLECISLSFLVESMTRWRGGVAPNIAYTMALLEQRPRLWAAVGEDFQEYREWLEANGIDTSGARVIPGVFTASFFVNTDRDNAQIASFYPGAMGYAAQLCLHDLGEALPDLVVISPNDPEAMMLYVEECRDLRLPYVYDPSQQIVRLTGEQLLRGIEGAQSLFVNEYEFALIQKMTGLNVAEFLAERPEVFIIVTCGKRGAKIFSGQDCHVVPAFPPKQIVDPTGVGDAFRGGFLTGLGHGLDLVTCGQMGSLAAAYCLEQAGPQGHSYSLSEFTRRFRSFFNDAGKLDVLAVEKTL
jgi:adenosine kinase